MADIDTNTSDNNTTVAQDAAAALFVSAASVAGTFIGIGAVLAAVGVTSKIKDVIKTKKNQKNND